MARNDFQYGEWNSYTLQWGTIMTLISPGDCTLQCGSWLWNHDSEFTKWQHPALWFVALGWHAVEFARLQHPAMWYVALGSWHWFARWQYPAMWQVALRWHATEFAQTSAILEFYIWFRFRPYHRCRRCHSAPVCEILSKSDHPKNDVMSIFKMAELSHLWF